MKTLDKIFEESNLNSRYLNKFTKKNITPDKLLAMGDSELKRLVKRRHERKKLKKWISNNKPGAPSNRHKHSKNTNNPKDSDKSEFDSIEEFGKLLAVKNRKVSTKKQFKPHLDEENIEFEAEPTEAFGDIFSMRKQPSSSAKKQFKLNLDEEPAQNSKSENENPKRESQSPEDFGDIFSMRKQPSSSAKKQFNPDLDDKPTPETKDITSKDEKSLDQITAAISQSTRTHNKERKQRIQQRNLKREYKAGKGPQKAATAADNTEDNAIDEFAKIMALQSAEKPATAKIAKPANFEFKKEAESLEEEKKMDNIFSLLSEKFREADYKEETLKNPKILKHADEIISDLREIFTPLFKSNKIEYVDKMERLIGDLQDNVDQMEEIKKELINYSATLKLTAESESFLEEIDECCVKLLSGHMLHFVLNKTEDEAVELVKLLFDVKYLVNYFQNRLEGGAKMKLISRYSKFADRMADAFIQRFPEDINDAQFVNYLYKIVKFERKLLLSIEKRLHPFYITPLKRVLEFYKRKFGQVKIELCKKETQKAVSLADKIQRLVGKKSWKTKPQRKNNYLPLEDCMVDPVVVVYKNVDNDFRRIVMALSQKIAVPQKDYKTSRKTYRREFKAISEYTLEILSSYKKTVFSMKTLQLFLKNAVSVHKVYFCFILSDVTEKPNKFYVNFLQEDANKAENKILKNLFGALKNHKGSEHVLDKWLDIASCASVSNECLQSVKELIELEFENYAEKMEFSDQMFEESKLENLLALICSKAIFDDYFGPIRKLYTRENKRKLVLFRGMGKDFKRKTEVFRKKVEPQIFKRMMEICFLVLMKVIEHKLFDGKSFFRANENRLIREDLIEIYAIFGAFGVSASLDDVDQVGAVKEFLSVMATEPAEVVEMHKKMKEEEAYPTEDEYYYGMRGSKWLHRSQNISEEDQILNTSGLLKLLLRSGNRETFEYARKENKQTALPYIRTEGLPKKWDGAMEGPEDTAELPELPIFESNRTNEGENYNIEPEESNALYAISLLNENQKLVKNGWKLTQFKPFAYTDDKFLANKSKEKTPETNNPLESWRWGTEWLASEIDWAYATRFTSKSFKVGNRTFLHKVRTRRLYRFRLLDSLDLYNETEAIEVLKIARTFISTVCWGIFKNINYRSNSEIPLLELENKSFSESAKKVELSAKGESVDSRYVYLSRKERDKMEKVTEEFAKTLKATSFDVTTKNADNFDWEHIEQIKELFHEIYNRNEDFSVKTALEYIKEIHKICVEINKLKNSKLTNVFSIEFLCVLISIVEQISQTDETEPLLTLCFMQTDAVSEGQENIFNFGLPYFEAQNQINSLLENLKVDDDSREWKHYIKKGGLEKVGKTMSVLEGWLNNYHKKSEGVEGVEETVCRMMEAYYYLGEIYIRYNLEKIDVRANLRKIMQQSIKTIIKKVENERPCDVEEWEQQDWEQYTADVMGMLVNEVEHYQNDIFIAGFNDPCKNSIIPILSAALTTCEKSLEKNELNTSFLAVIKFYSEIDTLLSEWGESHYFSENVIASMKQFVPVVDSKIRALLAHIVQAQYGLITSWITTSKEEEKPLENGKFTSFYSDSFSYLNDFALLFLDLLKQLPAKNVTADTCESFKSVFRSLVQKFVDINNDGMITVEDLISESFVLDVNKTKRDKPTRCNTNVFQYDFNDYEIEESESEDFEIESTAELCSIYSNLCLGQGRLHAISEMLSKEISKHTGDASFEIDIEPPEMQDKIDDTKIIIAHKIVFIDLGDHLFGKKHYKRDGDEKIHTEFDAIDKTAGEAVNEICERVQVKGSALPVLQALFDVYITTTIWLILGTTKHSYRADDVNEIRADFELFDIFKEDSKEIKSSTFEMESLKLVLSFLERPSKDLIAFHKAVSDAERKNTILKGQNIVVPSKFVFNPFNGSFYDPKEKQVSVSKNGILAILEHSDSSEAKKYLAQYAKQHKKHHPLSPTGEKRLNLENAAKAVIAEYEVVPQLMQMDDEVIKNVQMDRFTEPLCVLREFEQKVRNAKDIDLNWYFSNNRIFKEIENVYRKALGLCQNYEEKYKSDVHPHVLCVFMETVARFGFLLSRVKRDFEFSKGVLKEIIVNSGTKKVKKLRASLPAHILKFTEADWDTVTNTTFEFMEKELALHSKNNRIPLKQPSSFSLLAFLRPLGVEISETLRDPDSLKVPQNFVFACRYTKSVLDFIWACGNIRTASKEVQSEESDLYQSASRVFPNHEKGIKDIFQILLEKSFKEYKSDFSQIIKNPQMNERDEENTGVLHAKYCGSFETLLQNFKRSAFGFLKSIPLALLPKELETMFFSSLVRCLEEFARLNFPQRGVLDHVSGALNAAEKTREKGSFKENFVEHLSKLYSPGEKLTMSDECFSIPFICGKLENIRFVTSVLPLFSADLFEDIERLGLGWKASQNLSAGLYKETEQLLKLAGCSFICVQLGDAFLGDFLRKSGGSLAGCGKLEEDVPAAMGALKKKISTLNFYFVYDSIFACFVDLFRFLLMGSARVFARGDVETVKTAFGTLLDLFAGENTKLLKDKNIKELYREIQYFANKPEENIRIYKKIKRTGASRNEISAQKVLTVLSRMDSREAQRFAAANGVKRL